MRLSARFWSAAFGTLLCGILALPAQAADKLYMSIEGSHGPFRGEGTKPGSPWILIQAVDEQTSPSPESPTGRASAQRKNPRIRVIKQVGQASVQLHEALARAELLKRVVIEIARVNATGQEQVYRAIELTDALVADMRSMAPSAGNPAREEEITFSYKTIDQKYLPEGKAMPGRMEVNPTWHSPR